MTFAGGVGGRAGDGGFGGGGGWGGGGGGSSDGFGGGGGSLVNASYGVSQAAATHSGAGLVTSTTDTPFAGVTVADDIPGAPTDTLTITLSDANAALVVGASQPAGVTFTDVGGVYTLTGAAAGITSELDALKLVAPSTLSGTSKGAESS